MGRSRKKGDRKSDTRDRYEVRGEVGGNAVIVQGPEAHVEVTQRDATPSEKLRLAELADLDLLRRTLAARLGILKKQIRPSLETSHNPYKFGQALSFRESSLFVGRASVLDNLLANLNTESYVFLAGNGGSGKTSLLQAGILPSIVKQGDLPILVSLSSDSLEASIKRQVLAEVTQTLYLGQIPLSTFLGHVAESLPSTKQVYLLIDDLEDFLAREPSEIEAFKQQWLQCLTNSPRIHWLFSMHLGFSYLLNSFRPDINPFAELMILPPLDRESARQLIVKPASLVGIQIDDAVIEDVLDRLGGANISPAQLQTVCYLMAGGNGPIRLHWKLVDYESDGRADGILRQSVERLIGQLKRGDQASAWQVLAAIMEDQGDSASFDSLLERIGSYGVDSKNLSRLLKLLEENHLIDVHEERYQLASESMRPRIQQWVQKQNALVQARQEALHQLRQLRNSALRGMFGGAFGFILFDLLIYTGVVPDFSYFVFFLVLDAAIGGIAGFLLTLTVDLAIAAYHGSQTWLRYFVGGIGGGIAFAIGLLLYANNNYIGDSLLRILPSTIVEGALWGVVIGLGTTFALSGTRQSWVIAVVTALAAGFLLLGLEFQLHALINERWSETSSVLPIFLADIPAALRIFLAGMLLPFCYMAAALFRRSGIEKG